MSFSSDYKTSLRNSKLFTSDSFMEEHLVHWSSKVINTLHNFFQDSNHHFKVLVTIDPNPSSVKGVDQCKIEIWQMSNARDTLIKPFIKLMSDKNMTLSSCIQDINEKIDILTQKDVPEVIELNGKKYRLTEIE